MSKKEMLNVDGGHPVLWLLAGVLISSCMDRDSISDFWEGYESVRH